MKEKYSYRNRDLMRIESKEIVQAFLAKKSKHAARTHTDGNSLFLFGNRIAWWDGPAICMTLCGHPSMTTRDRLNTLCFLYAGVKPWSQRKRVPTYNDEEIGDTEIVRLEKISLQDITV